MMSRAILTGPTRQVPLIYGGVRRWSGQSVRQKISDAAISRLQQMAQLETQPLAERYRGRATVNNDPKLYLRAQDETVRTKMSKLDKDPPHNK